MSLDRSDSRAVIDLLSWLAEEPSWDGGRVRDTRAIDAMAHLATAAGVDGMATIAHIVERLQAADSDGAAQAVCRALDEHSSTGGRIPWPSVLQPFLRWKDVQAGSLGERLRGQTTGATS